MADRVEEQNSILNSSITEKSTESNVEKTNDTFKFKVPTVPSPNKSKRDEMNYSQELQDWLNDTTKNFEVAAAALRDKAMLTAEIKRLEALVAEQATEIMQLQKKNENWERWYQSAPKNI